MNQSIRNYFHTSWHGATVKRCSGVGLGQGSTSVNKLPVQMFCWKNLKNLKKYKKCKSKKCLTCPRALKDQIANSSNVNIFCKTKNIVYLIECGVCGLQYVGQTGNDFNIRINGHRSNIKHFNSGPCDDFEILHFQEHNFNQANFIILKEVTDLNDRLNYENLFICNLNSLFPYGLNSRLNGEGTPDLNSSCIMSKFKIINNYNWFKINRRGCRGKGKNPKTKLNIKSFKNLCQIELNFDNIKQIKTFIFQQKNKDLKWAIKNYWNTLIFKNETIKSVIKDCIKFKIGEKSFKMCTNNYFINKEYCIINYSDKIIEKCEFSRALHELMNIFPINNFCKISLCFKYGKTLRNIFCNYNSICKDLNCISDSDCHCNNLEFQDFVNKDYGHIITGNLDLIKCNDLKALIKLGSKFRTRKFFNFDNLFTSIEGDINFFITKCARKYNWPIEGFQEWKTKLILRLKFNFYKNKQKNFEGIYLNKNLLNEIDKIKNNFCVAIVDKASNNFCFVCKVFLKNLLIQEYVHNNTYICINNSEKVIGKRILALSKRIKIKLNNVKFPYLFPTIKFHKQPVKFRFVTCSTFCYNSYFGKLFFKYLKIILSNIFKLENNFIIDNNQKLLNYLNNNIIKTVNTFDFENLYTSIPHDNLIDICNFYFKYLEESNINREDWLDLCRVNIKENFLFNGISFYKQIKGIPMGNSFSSAFANIFLHFYEFKYLNKYNINAFRYIDDLIIFDFENFEDLFNIYPKGLKLNQTNNNKFKVNYLDLKIDISNNKTLIGIYDKRIDFNFKVKVFTDYHSNLNSKIFKNIFFSQFNRIKKICNNFNDFNYSINIFKKCLINNNFPPNFHNFDNMLKRALVEYSFSG